MLDFTMNYPPPPLSSPPLPWISVSHPSPSLCPSSSFPAFQFPSSSFISHLPPISAYARGTMVLPIIATLAPITPTPLV